MIEAYEPPPPNGWVRPVTLLTIAIIAIWNLAGWWLSEGPLAFRVLLCALTFMFELLCTNVSAQKSRAELRDVGTNVRRFWFWTLVMCCAWSAFCAHHALATFTPDMTDLERAPAAVILVLAACVLPVMPWAIERTQDAPLLAKDAAHQANATHPRASAELPPRADETAAVRNFAKAAMAASAVGVLPAGTLPIDRPPVAAHVQALDSDAWRERARALWIGGEPNKSAIARAVGRPRETVRRELAKLGA